MDAFSNRRSSEIIDVLPNRRSSGITGAILIREQFRNNGWNSDTCKQNDTTKVLAFMKRASLWNDAAWFFYAVFIVLF
jgi:hypothetical protein